MWAYLEGADQIGLQRRLVEQHGRQVHKGGKGHVQAVRGAPSDAGRAKRGEPRRVSGRVEVAVQRLFPETAATSKAKGPKNHD